VVSAGAAIASVALFSARSPNSFKQDGFCSESTMSLLLVNRTGSTAEFWCDTLLGVNRDSVLRRCRRVQGGAGGRGRVQEGAGGRDGDRARRR
jgi:hypothetical protein